MGKIRFNLLPCKSRLLMNSFILCILLLFFLISIYPAICLLVALICPEISVKPKRKRRERFKEEETLAVENGNCNGVLGENKDGVLGENKEQEAVVKSDKMDPDLHLRNKTYQGPSNA